MFQSPQAPLKTFDDVYPRPIDAKKRITIPAQWRFQGDDVEGVSRLFLQPDYCLMIVPPWRLQALAAAQAATGLFDREKQRIASKLAAISTSVCLDKQGRLLLQDKWLQFAGIEREVVLVGESSVYKLYSPQRWAEVELEAMQPSFFEDLQKLGL